MEDSRIDDKIKEVSGYLDELDSIKPITLDEYKKDLKSKAACERYFEKIMEAVIDLGFMTIKSRSLETPKDDGDLFNVLKNNKVIDLNLAKRMKEAKGMKNFISHQYGEVNDELVFNSITKELEKDIKAFIEQVKK